MSSNDDLIAKLPMARIAAELGVDGPTATATIRLTLPAILVGLKANAQDPARAASLGKAVTEHPSEPWASKVDLSLVNPVEGAKVVANIFGKNTESVIIRLAGSPPVAAAGTALTRKALNIMAPIVLTYLNQAYVESQRPPTRSTSSPTATPPAAPLITPSVIQELLESLVPSASAAAAAASAATASATANATAAATAAVRAATPRPATRPEIEEAPVAPAAAPAAAVEPTAILDPVRAPGSRRAEATALAGQAATGAVDAAAVAVDVVGGLLSGLVGYGRKA